MNGEVVEMIASAKIVGIRMADLAKMSSAICCIFVTLETAPTTVYGAPMVSVITQMLQ